ncbi:efflux RND transporter periplasmic adaptor subunit [Mesorhizobium sp. 10J20-29]
MADRPDIKKVIGVGKTQGRTRRMLLAGLAIVLLGLAGWYWIAQSSQGDAQTYLTAEIERGDLTVTVTATGTVEPTNLVEISSELSGTVRAVNVDHNDTVTVGQVLAQLDTDKLEASLARSRAALDSKLARVAEAEATVAETKEQYDRIKELAMRKVVSVQSLQAAAAGQARAEAGVALARADVKVAEADLRMEETNLTKACICSPIHGVVLTRNVDVGQIVASSLQAPVLFTIAENLAQMELRVDIDEADVGTVSVGQKASFTVEAYQGRTFPAEIAELRYAPQTVDGVVTYQAILSIDNSAGLLRPGLTATANITVEQIPDALLVSNAALRFAPPVEVEQKSSGGGLLGLIMPRRPGGPAEASNEAAADGSRTLWVLRDGTAVAVPVRTGATDGLKTAIVEGDVAPGDAAITDQTDGT